MNVQLGKLSADQGGELAELFVGLAGEHGTSWSRETTRAGCSTVDQRDEATGAGERSWDQRIPGGAILVAMSRVAAAAARWGVDP